MSSTLNMFGPPLNTSVGNSCTAVKTRILTTTDMDYFEDDLYECVLKDQRGSFLDYMRKGLSVNHVFRSTERPERLGKTLMDIAVLEGSASIAKTLVDRKCNVNLLYIANVNQFVWQLEECQRRRRLKLTCMYRCIVKGDLEMIRLLVQGGFDVNICDERDCTALWHALDLDNYAMLKIMASAKGCDVNAADNAKLRPIHIAAMRGNVKMMSLLIQRGADVDIVQLRGSTPLVLACRAGNYDTVRILLLNGANPNHVGNNGHNVISTALQYTMDRRIPEMIVDCGALIDLDLLDKMKKDLEKFPIIDACPELRQNLQYYAETPRSLKTFCCLNIRLQLVRSARKMHLIKKVELLPLPRLIKDFLLYGHV